MQSDGRAMRFFEEQRRRQDELGLNWVKRLLGRILVWLLSCCSMLTLRMRSSGENP